MRTRCDSPGKRHNRSEKVGNGFPIPVEVELSELDAHSKALYTNNQSGDFLQDFVVETPMAGPGETQGIGTENNTEEDSEWRFGEMKMISNELRKERGDN